MAIGEHGCANGGSGMCFLGASPCRVYAASGSPYLPEACVCVCHDVVVRSQERMEHLQKVVDELKGEVVALQDAVEWERTRRLEAEGLAENRGARLQLLRGRRPHYPFLG